MAGPSASDVAATLDYRTIRQFLRLSNGKTHPTLVANKPSSVELDRGITYHRLHYHLTVGGNPVSLADAKAYGSLKIMVDGDAFIDETLDQIIARQDFHNGRGSISSYDATTGILTVHLAQPWAQETAAQDGPAYGMKVGGPNGVQTATVSFTSSDLAKIDAVEFSYEWDDAAYMGRHFRTYHILGNQSSSGDLVIDQWPIKDPTAVIQAIHLKSTAVTNVRLNVDKGDDIEKMGINFIHRAAVALGKVLQTGWTHIAFDNRGRPRDGMPVIFQNGRLVLTTGSALNAYDMIVEVLEGVDPAAG